MSIDLSTVRFICPNCMQELDHRVDLISPGCNDPTVTVIPCPNCYLTEDESKEVINNAKADQEHDTTMEVLRMLLNQASVMTTNDWNVAPDKSQVDNLKKIIESHEDLEPFIYLIDKEFKRDGKEGEQVGG